MKNYRLTIFAEDYASVLDTIISAMTYRNVSVMNVLAEESSVKGINKFTVDTVTNNSNMNNVVRQLEKNVYILKALLLKDNSKTVCAHEEQKILSNFIN